MTEAELMQLLAAITPPDDAARAAAHAHWASLAKPLGGLGALETLLEDAAALTGKAQFDFPAGGGGALRRQRRSSAGRKPDRPERDPHRGREPCRAAHQRLPDGAGGALRCAAGGYGHSRVHRCPVCGTAALPPELRTLPKAPP